MRKYILLILGLILMTIGVVIYKKYNPINHSLFPKCPVKYVIGLDCPGCGSQRAIHHLLNGELIQAAKSNLLAVVFLPYIVLGLFTNFLEKESSYWRRIRKTLLGYHAILTVLIIIILFTILRNII